MNKQYYSINLLLICNISYTQNLVSNPSFETLINCPTNTSGACVWFNDQVASSTAFWHNVGCGSADYFHGCNNTKVGVPNNIFGYQYARTGTAYIGLYVEGGGSSWCLNYREYITSPLSDSLLTNVKYYVEFYTNRNNLMSSSDSSDALGVLFTIGEPDTIGTNSACSPLQYTAQVNNPDGYFITDTMNWVKISGTFIATGSENYITIGNFKDTSMSHGWGYYYIDDVMVIAESILATQENSDQKIISLLPNPVGSTLKISTNTNVKSEITIYDITSRKIFNQYFAGSTLLNTEQLAKGVYRYEVRNKNEVIKKGKIVKL